VTAIPVVKVDIRDAFARLGRVLAASRNLQPVLAGPVNESVNEFFVRQFDSEGAYGGEKWKPLSPLSLKLRQRRGHGRGGILHDTGRMWASLTKLGLGPDAIRRVTAQSLERGTSVPYAISHQKGFKTRIFGRGRKRKVPKRVIIPDPMPSRVVEGWVSIIGAHVAQEG
jgi:phage gpG-like protein